MIRRPPRSTPKPSSAASDVYKRQGYQMLHWAKVPYVHDPEEQHLLWLCGAGYRPPLQQAAVPLSLLRIARILWHMHVGDVFVVPAFSLRSGYCGSCQFGHAFTTWPSDSFVSGTNLVFLQSCFPSKLRQDLAGRRKQTVTHNINERVCNLCMLRGYLPTCISPVSYTHLTLPTKA